MGYYMKQYAKPRYHDDNTKFMSVLDGSSNYTANYYLEDLDESITEQGLYFANPGIRGKFELNHRYYVHALVKRLETTQTINIVLMKNNNATSEDYEEQLIKTIVIPGFGEGGNSNNWVDIDVSFTPFKTFTDDTTYAAGLVFQLVRTQIDYNTGDPYTLPRIPVVIFLELSKINDMIDSVLGLPSNNSIIKLGCHTNPGLKMYLNDSEVMVGKSGIYELNNNVLTIEYLSILAPAAIQENKKTMLAEKELTISQTYETNIIGKIGSETSEAKEERVLGTELGFVKPAGRQFFTTGVWASNYTNIYSIYDSQYVLGDSESGTGNRDIQAFTLDYVYKDNTEN